MKNKQVCLSAPAVCCCALENLYQTYVAPMGSPSTGWVGKRVSRSDGSCLWAHALFFTRKTNLRQACMIRPSHHVLRCHSPYTLWE